MHKEDSIIKHGEEVNNKKQSDQESLAQTKDPGGFFLDECSDNLGNQESLVQNKDPRSSLRTSTLGQFRPA
jgi:hypothetical protein